MAKTRVASISPLFYTKVSGGLPAVVDISMYPGNIFYVTPVILLRQTLRDLAPIQTVLLQRLTLPSGNAQRTKETSFLLCRDTLKQ